MKNKPDLDLTDFSVEQLKKTVRSLERENKACFLTVEKLLKDISKKNEEIEHLKTVMKDMVPIMSVPKQEPKIIRVEVSAEEQIAEMQLERLRHASEMRPLTLEEARMYDILVKNKRLAQDQSTINLTQKDYQNLSNTDLLEIVGKTENEPKDQSE